MSQQGTIVQCIGAAVDVEFPNEVVERWTDVLV
jgi:hypothetical protein